MLSMGSFPDGYIFINSKDVGNVPLGIPIAYEVNIWGLSKSVGLWTVPKHFVVVSSGTCVICMYWYLKGFWLILKEAAYSVVDWHLCHCQGQGSPAQRLCPTPLSGPDSLGLVLRYETVIFFSVNKAIIQWVTTTIMASILNIPLQYIIYCNYIFLYIYNILFTVCLLQSLRTTWVIHTSVSTENMSDSRGQVDL